MEQIPPDLRKALAASIKAKAAWDDITPIARRDFIRWVVSAKKAETRARRVTVAIDKLVSGQRRPCCYAVVPTGIYRALETNAKAKATWKSLTPDERRDYVAWVDEAGEGKRYEQRIEKACALLAAGKRRP